MMQKAEAAAIKVGAPFYGYANGDILFTEDLIVSLRLVLEAVEADFFVDRPGPLSCVRQERPAFVSGLLVMLLHFSSDRGFLLHLYPF